MVWIWLHHKVTRREDCLTCLFSRISIIRRGLSCVVLRHFPRNRTSFGRHAEIPPRIFAKRRRFTCCLLGQQVVVVDKKCLSESVVDNLWAKEADVLHQNYMQMERKRDNHHQGQNRSKDNKRQVKMGEKSSDKREERAGCQTFVKMKENTFLIRNYHYKKRKRLSSVKMTFLSRITPLLKTYLFLLDCFPSFVTNVTYSLSGNSSCFPSSALFSFLCPFPQNSLFITSWL